MGTSLLTKWYFILLLISGTLSQPSVEVANQYSSKKNISYQQTRIVGGTKVTDRTRFYYQASLRYRRSGVHFCGGTIIAPSLILTAAHCMKIGPSRFFVVVGDLNKDESSSTTIRRRVTGVRVHPHYRKTLADVAIVILSQELEFSPFVGAIPLATKKPRSGTMCTISGWGAIGFDKPESSILLYAEVPIVDFEKCAEAYEELRHGMLCAGYMDKGGVDSCQGDSGGPLICDNVLAGVVSWGKRCALRGYPGVYADVAYFSQWIYENSSSRNTDFSINIKVLFLLLVFLFD